MDELRWMNQDAMIMIDGRLYNSILVAEVLIFSANTRYKNYMFLLLN